jgi:hypothetical protein
MAQSSLPLDTIYANEHKNVALFFAEPIRQGITGSDNFVFTYNREKEQYFGLLQATPGRESNLLVINRNGSVFSYIVRYRKQIEKLNYFIPESNSIGNENPKKSDSPRDKDSDNELTPRSIYYKSFSEILLKRPQSIAGLKKRSEGIVLKIENIVFDREELYFVIQIKNNSTLDYDLNFLNLSLQTRQKGKKKSLQTLYQQPRYAYNVPAKITKKETKKMVYVLPKFSLATNAG